MTVTKDDFNKIWASTSSVPTYTFSDTDYQNGWEFVGNLPPTRAMWDEIQRKNDEKMQLLYNGASFWVDSVADLRTADAEIGTVYATKGYYAPNDGGNGFYIIRADNSDTDDGGSTIIMNNGNVAELVMDARINAKQFGCYCDGTHDDTTAFRNAIYAIGKVINNHTQGELYVPGKLRITERIIVNRGGFVLKGDHLSTSRIICDGETAGLTFQPVDGVRTIYENSIRDISVVGNESNTEPIIEFNNCYNVYLYRLYVAKAGSGVYDIHFGDGCGIVFIDTCTIDGASTVDGTRNGILCDSAGTILSISRCNVWNLNNFLKINGNVTLLNVTDNWIECVKSLFVSDVTSLTAAVVNINITQNVISTHNYSDFSVTDYNLVTILSTSSTTLYKSIVNVSYNTIYLWDMTKFVNNSVINIEGGMTAGAPMEIVYEGNRYSGKTHGQLSSYIYKNNINANYLTIRISKVTIMSTTDADYITDTASLKQFGTTLTQADTLWCPNGINVNTSRPTAPNYGKLYYSSGHFYGTYEGTVKILPEASGVTIANSTATTVADLVNDFNALVNALKTTRVVD